jgi:hypothetical protein
MTQPLTLVTVPEAISTRKTWRASVISENFGECCRGGTRARHQQHSPRARCRRGLKFSAAPFKDP